jgi:hypothetical protein
VGTINKNHKHLQNIALFFVKGFSKRLDNVSYDGESIEGSTMKKRLLPIDRKRHFRKPIHSGRRKRERPLLSGLSLF